MRYNDGASKRIHGDFWYVDKARSQDSNLAVRRSGLIILLSFNVIGITAGNFMTGAISDLLEPRLGIQSLRWALAMTMVGALVGLVLMQYSTRRLHRDLVSGDRPAEA